MSPAQRRPNFDVNDPCELQRQWRCRFSGTGRLAANADSKRGCHALDQRNRSQKKTPNLQTSFAAAHCGSAPIPRNRQFCKTATSQEARSTRLWVPVELSNRGAKFKTHVCTTHAQSGLHCAGASQLRLQLRLRQHTSVWVKQVCVVLLAKPVPLFFFFLDQHLLHLTPTSSVYPFRPFSARSSIVLLLCSAPFCLTCRGAKQHISSSSSSSAFLLPPRGPLAPPLLARLCCLCCRSPFPLRHLQRLTPRSSTPPIHLGFPSSATHSKQPSPSPPLHWLPFSIVHPRPISLAFS